MNKLEIFQEVYGKGYAFTETELSRLLGVTELIVQECADLVEVEYGQSEVTGSEIARVLKRHFGVDF